ncbi:hypothetical protein B0T18DRAFT_484350 [Schizothecium vesticola]|uniref:Uncharacterized protein n=1 Tax=Schizothecium vesticola TaxID=314040 RepID=A0AA40KCG2_9PEZI|nr:hypothetical protein B0T18DRAFT_484350 [Schizothecium vesticola]
MTTSLLELNTLAHALCALALYSLWWNKPLDIEEPTPCRGPDTEFICSGPLMRCVGLDFRTMPYRRGVRLVYENYGIVYERRDDYYEVLDYDSYGVSGFFLSMRKDRNEKFFGTPSSGIGLDHDENDQGSHQNHECRLYMGHSLSGFAFYRRSEHLICPSQQEFSTPLTIRRPYVVLTKSDITRFSMAQQCYERHPSLAPSTDGGWQQEFVVHRSSDIVQKSNRTPGSYHKSRARQRCLSGVSPGFPS